MSLGIRHLRHWEQVNDRACYGETIPSKQAKGKIARITIMREDRLTSAANIHPLRGCVGGSGVQQPTEAYPLSQLRTGCNRSMPVNQLSAVPGGSSRVCSCLHWVARENQKAASAMVNAIHFKDNHSEDQPDCHAARWIKADCALIRWDTDASTMPKADQVWIIRMPSVSMTSPHYGWTLTITRSTSPRLTYTH